MINKYTLTKTWSKLTQARHIKDSLPIALIDVEFSVLCLIAHNDGAMTINKILQHPYYDNGNSSISTIKRAVNKLLINNIIESVANPLDKRERILKIKEKL
jgi:DNA-binding MarR family transcriptional regulator